MQGLFNTLREAGLIPVPAHTCAGQQLGTEMSEKLDPYSVLAGQRIKLLRDERNWSRMDLAKASGYNPATGAGGLSDTRLANYERGIRQPGLAEIMLLADVFLVAPAYIAGFTPIRFRLSPQERELVTDFRALPENEREALFRTITVKSLPYRKPVRAERFAETWTPPPAVTRQAKTAQKRGKATR